MRLVQVAGMTQRFGAVIRLRPERETEYRDLHRAVWPSVLEALHKAHVRNYSIYLWEGLLFSYLEYEGDDYEADMAALSQDEQTRRWWALTDPCQARVEPAAGGEWWTPMQEVFHCD